MTSDILHQEQVATPDDVAGVMTDKTGRSAGTEGEGTMDNTEQPGSVQALEVTQSMPILVPSWDPDLIWDEGGWPVGRVERNTPSQPAKSPH
jgi:hypothetical protein